MNVKRNFEGKKLVCSSVEDPTGAAPVVAKLNRSRDRAFGKGLKAPGTDESRWWVRRR